MESFNGIVIEDDQTIDQKVDVRNLQIYGNAVFREDVDADEIEVFGNARFVSFLSCDRLVVYGQATLPGGLLTESVQIDGNMNVSGTFRTEVALVDGTLNMQGKFSGMKVIVRSRARLEAAGRFRAERFTLAGTAYCAGSLNGEDIEIVSCEKSEIARVRASEITVKYKPRGDVPELGEGEYVLSSYLLDAPKIDIEYTAADTVECDSAVIGPGCRIGELYYKDDVEILEGSVVERLYKL